MTDTRIETWIDERKRIHAAATEGPWEADLDQHGETRGVWPTRPGGETIIGAYVAADGFDSVGYALGSDEDLTAIVDAHNHLPALVAMVEAVLGVLNENTPPDPCQPDDPAGMCPDCSLIREIRRALEAARKAVSGDE